MSLKSLASHLAVLSAIAAGFCARPAAGATNPGLTCADLAQLTLEGTAAGRD